MHGVIIDRYARRVSIHAPCYCHETHSPPIVLRCLCCISSKVSHVLGKASPEFRNESLKSKSFAPPSKRPRASLQLQGLDQFHTLIRLCRSRTWSAARIRLTGTQVWIRLTRPGHTDILPHLQSLLTPLPKFLQVRIPARPKLQFKSALLRGVHG